MLKILFFGSSDFPVPIIEKLHSSKQIQIVGLVTSASDKNNHSLEIAKNLKIPVFPVDSLSTKNHILKKTKPDLNLVCNFGLFLNEYFLNFPKLGSINIHASILPKLRGACPIESAILNGYKESGITIQKMVSKMDAGDIISSVKIQIDKRETGGSLRKKLQELATQIIEETIISYYEGKIKPTKQNEDEATFCYMKDISKEAAEISWENEALFIERQIRAFNPNPGAWSKIKINNSEKRVKIFTANIVDLIKKFPAGKTLVDEGKLLVQCKDQALEILELQLEGKKRLFAGDFIRGIKGKFNFV